MKDRLKESVEGRRTEFELYDSDLPALWDNIEDRLDSRRPGLWWIASRVAASVLIIALASIFAISLEVTETKDGYALRDISPELAETEYFYSTQVQEKLTIIKTSNAYVDPEVMDNLKSLDREYDDLKKDLKDNADNEEVVAAMIDNYRLKLDILEQILQEIRQHKNNDDGEVNI